MADPQWHYRQDDGRRIGPVSHEDLCELFARNELGPDTPVRSTAFPQWTPASKIPGLRALIGVAAPRTAGPPAPLPPPLPAGYSGQYPTTPPPPPPMARRADLEYAGPDIVGDPTVPQVRPWVRYWARAIDGGVNLILLIVLIVVFARTVETLGLGGALVLNAAVYFLGLCVEAFFLSTFGTTLGKWLLGVVVRDQDGNKLSFGQALNRAFMANLLGLGFGVIPLVSLITLVLSYQKLKTEGSTWWDSGHHYRVSHRRIGFVKGGLAVCFLCSPIILLVALIFTIGVIANRSARAGRAGNWPAAAAVGNAGGNVRATPVSATRTRRNSGGFAAGGGGTFAPKVAPAAPKPEKRVVKPVKIRKGAGMKDGWIDPFTSAPARATDANAEREKERERERKRREAVSNNGKIVIRRTN